MRVKKNPKHDNTHNPKRNKTPKPPPFNKKNPRQNNLWGGENTHFYTNMNFWKADI